MPDFIFKAPFKGAFLLKNAYIRCNTWLNSARIAYLLQNKIASVVDSLPRIVCNAEFFTTSRTICNTCLSAEIKFRIIG